MAIMGLPIISFFMPLATHKALAPAIRRPCVLNELRNRYMNITTLNNLAVLHIIRVVVVTLGA